MDKPILSSEELQMIERLLVETLGPNCVTPLYSPDISQVRHWTGDGWEVYVDSRGFPMIRDMAHEMGLVGSEVPRYEHRGVLYGRRPEAWLVPPEKGEENRAWKVTQDLLYLLSWVRSNTEEIQKSPLRMSVSDSNLVPRVSYSSSS
jgi:hypothetical protein